MFRVAAKWIMKSVKLSYNFINVKRYCGIQKVLITITKLREDTWKDIGNEMKMPVQDLKKKMTTLLASYRREKSRIKKSHITGSGTYIFIKLLVGLYHLSVNMLIQ